MRKLSITALVLSSVLLAAQEAASSPQSITVAKIFADGGWVMYVIAVLSIIAVALAVFYLLSMRKEVLCPKAFVSESIENAKTGNAAAIGNLCRQSAAPAARIVEAAIQEYPAQESVLRSAMEDEGARQAATLWQRLQFLMDVAVISPMVGLLGTVWGLMVSFGGIENGADFAKKAETMASGISQAIYTTFGGLVVGIFAMVLHNLFRAKLSKMITEMETSCSAILRALVKSQEQQK